MSNGELILSNESGKIIYKKHYDIMQKNLSLQFGETLPPADYILTIRDNEEILYRGRLMNQKNSITRTVHINDNVTGANAISVRPNPYVDNFIIDVKRELKNVSLVMMDIQGRVVYKRDFKTMYGQTRVDLGYLLPAGSYILVIRNEQEILFRQSMIARK